MFLLLFTGLVLPGFFLSVLIARKDQVLMLAMPLSIALYVAIAISFFCLEQTQWVFAVYLTIGAMLMAFVLSRSALRKSSGEALLTHPVLLPLSLVVIVYQLLVGPFVDFGVDVYRHMSFTQIAQRALNANAGQLQIAVKTGTNNLFFHNINAWFAWVTNSSAANLIQTISSAYSLIWTISVYLFANTLFAMMGLARNRLTLYSLVCVGFYWLGFGINSFSFPRYYIAGPAIVTHAMYLATLTISLQLLREKISLRQCFLLAIVAAAMGFMHPQEVLLLSSFLMTMALVLVLKGVLGGGDFQDIPLGVRNIALSLLVLIVAAAGVFCAIYFFPKYDHDPIPIFNLGNIRDSLVGWNILRPTHQFFTVAGWWGLFVLALAVILVKHTSKSAIALVILFYPLVTVFNPIFAEAVMKLSYPAVLWRILFGWHLPVLACFAIWILMNRWQQHGTSIKVGSVTAVAMLIVLLLPFKVGPFSNELVKTISLSPTPASNSWRHWEEMLNYLDGRDGPEKVLTDPVSAFAIRSMTNHIVRGYKFFPKKGYKRINYATYADHPLGKYKGWLLVINLKDGADNARLKPPYHIYPDVMSVERYYSAALLEEVSSRGDRYRVVWSNDSQRVLEIL